MIRIKVSRARTNRNSWWRKVVKHALSHQTMAHDTEWNRREIVKFLEESGAKISPHFWEAGRDDNYLEFENDADATAFMLRWS